MKAISLWQPWASLWCSPAKVHETRHWATARRGPLAVHAAKKIIRDVPPELADICAGYFGPGWQRSLPCGAIIGGVVLIDCEATEHMQPDTAVDALCGDFSPERFAWKRGAFWRLDAPVSYKGAQGFFDVPDHVARGAIV